MRGRPRGRRGRTASTAGCPPPPGSVPRRSRRSPRLRGRSSCAAGSLPSALRPRPISLVDGLDGARGASRTRLGPARERRARRRRDGARARGRPRADEPARGRGPRCCPTLDPTTMGWKEREWYLGPHERVLFDRNGNAGPTVWWDGRVVGGWSQREDGEIVFELLEDVGAERPTGSRAAAMARDVARARLSARCLRRPLARADSGSPRRARARPSADRRTRLRPSAALQGSAPREAALTAAAVRFRSCGIPLANSSARKISFAITSRWICEVPS